MQLPDRADILALMRRHPSWPGPDSGNPAAAGVTAAGVQSALASPTRPRLPPAQDAAPGHRISTPAAATHTEDRDSDSDGADGVSDDAEDARQGEVMSAAAAMLAAARRGRGSRTYTADEQAVMDELRLSSLTNIFRRTRESGSVRWRVKLSGEGLARKSRELCGKFPPSLPARYLMGVIIPTAPFEVGVAV